jgi:cell division protein FtsI (penicillin-binding protein 3)
MNIKQSILLRVRLAFLAVLLFALAVVGRIAHIQIVEGDKWIAMGEATMFDYRKVKATRGNIYSDNGSLLATSLPFYKVAFDATLPRNDIFYNEVDSLALLLSRFYKDRTPTEYKRMLVDARKQGRQYIIINRKQIDYQDKKMMETWPLFREGRYRGGVIFEKMDVRYRPFAGLSRRTIGFVNEENKGAGLEYSFNKYLAGQDGYAYYQKIAGGIWKPVYDANNVKAINGLDIHTTLDVNLQDVAETALYKAMVQHRADDGLVVVMEVQTGEVKAISNLSHDGNGHYYEKFNFATGGLFEPGSTFKLVTLIALLEDSPVKLTDSVDTGNGEMIFHKKYKVRDHEEGGLGRVTVREAFEHSSNVAMARLTDEYFGKNPMRFVQHIERLKLNKPLGIQIAGEPEPRFTFPGQKGWSGISLPWMAYGYGFEITPLHTLALYNAVANDGKMIKPLFVRAVSKADATVERFRTESMVDKICSNKTLRQLQQLLEGVVENGTARNIRGTHYRIAGKTGTAQILENGQYTKKYITSFVGYFPAHQPRYSAIVLIRNPRGWQQYGSSVAAPVFKEIADNIYARDLRIHTAMEFVPYHEPGTFPLIRGGKLDELMDLSNRMGISNHAMTEEAWVRSVKNGNAVMWKSAEINKERVPDVTGFTLRDAMFLLEECGLTVLFEGNGRVQSQSVAPGSRAHKGNRIYLKLG